MRGRGARCRGPRPGSRHIELQYMLPVQSLSATRSPRLGEVRRLSEHAQGTRGPSQLPGEGTKNS